MKTKKELEALAEEFIKDCNAFPLVRAKEGGQLELSSLLVDFVKYQENARIIRRVSL